MYTLRPYQKEASDAAVKFFYDNDPRNGIIVAPTASGKSLIISDIASRLDEPLIIFQPSKEILEQNYDKLLSYGIEAGIFSASCGKREIKQITLATIGSVKNYAELFDEFHYVMVDECHLCSPDDGMYKTFFSRCKRKILGLTATPYRLRSLRIHKKDGGKYDYDNKAMLEFLTTMKGKLFERVVYQIQIKTLLDNGYLAKLNYYNLRILDDSLFARTSNGTSYTDESVKNAMAFFNFRDCLVNIVERLQHPKSGIKRRGILVFTSFVEESEYLKSKIPNCEVVTGSTKKKERDRILKDFKDGKVEVVANCNCLSAGFDYPALDTVVLASPTMSLAKYLQQVGRCIRQYPGKEGWIVDLCCNIDRFGKMEDTFFYAPDGKPMVCGKVDGKNKKLTNRPL